MTAGRALLLALLACSEEPEPVPPDDDPPPDVDARAFVFGSAPWDPFFGTLDESLAAPLVNDADGSVKLEALAVEGEVYAWRAAGDGLEAPGAYTIAEVRGVPVEPPLEVAVLPYGREPSFDAASVVGVVWRLEADAEVMWPEGSGELARSFRDEEDLHLQVLSVDGEQASFRIVGTYQGSPRCEILRATGELTPSGELAWSEDAIDPTTATGDLVALRDAWLHLGWLGDASAAGGVEGGVRFDAEALSVAIWGADGADELCNLISTLAIDCVACDDVPSGRCLQVVFHAGTLVPSEVALEDPLPTCGVDLAQGGPPDLSCDLEPIDCGCDSGRAAGLPSAFALSLMVFRRRKRRADP